MRPAVNTAARLCGAAVALALCAGGAAGLAAADPTDYAGAAVCKTCHSAIYDSWKLTAHATGERWKKQGEADPVCRGCHMTGDAPAGKSTLGGVQCEACHGAGAAYAADDIMRNPNLSAALGLVPLAKPGERAAACARCHRADVSIRAFDPDAAWKKIAHP